MLPANYCKATQVYRLSHLVLSVHLCRLPRDRMRHHLCRYHRGHRLDHDCNTAQRNFWGIPHVAFKAARQDTVTTSPTEAELRAVGGLDPDQLEEWRPAGHVDGASLRFSPNRRHCHKPSRAARVSALVVGIPPGSHQDCGRSGDRETREDLVRGPTEHMHRTRGWVSREGIA